MAAPTQQTQGCGTEKGPEGRDPGVEPRSRLQIGHGPETRERIEHSVSVDAGTVSQWMLACEVPWRGCNSEEEGRGIPELTKTKIPLLGSMEA